MGDGDALCRNFHTANIRLFIAEVEKATDGKLAIQLHNNASLLPMGQIKRGVQTGQVQLGEILLSAYSNEDPFFEVDGVPFLAWTWPQAEALNAATEPYVRARMERQGLTLLYMAHWDAQGFYAKTEIRSVAELKGTRFRAYNNVTARMAELMGATPVTVQAAEVSQAFATNVIQSMFTSAQTGVNVTAWDFTRYWINVGGMRTRNAVFANTRALQALDAPSREALFAAAATASVRAKELAKQAEVVQSGRLRGEGHAAAGAVGAAHGRAQDDRRDADRGSGCSGPGRRASRCWRSTGRQCSRQEGRGKALPPRPLRFFWVGYSAASLARSSRPAATRASPMRRISAASSFFSGGRTTARGSLPSSTSASFIRLCMSKKGSA